VTGVSCGEIRLINDSQSDEHLGKQRLAQPAEFRCRIVTRLHAEVRFHPSYLRHNLSVSAGQLSVLATLGDLAFREPIVITRDGVLIDGYARWELARQQKRDTILCIEHEMTETEGLQELIRCHRPSRGLSSYMRVLLALELEPALQEQARPNQIAGGKNKNQNPSSLTEASSLDVRAMIAEIAGVSTGNVTKVKHLRKNAHPRVERALQAGEISIHKAWQYSELPFAKQLEELAEYRSRKGTNKTSRRLIKKHLAERSPSLPLLPSLGELLKPFAPGRLPLLDSISVSEIDIPGTIAYLTKGALATIKLLEEMKCSQDTC
jgi:hypothetical protein